MKKINFYYQLAFLLYVISVLLSFFNYGLIEADESQWMVEWKPLLWLFVFVFFAPAFPFTALALLFLLLGWRNSSRQSSAMESSALSSENLSVFPLNPLRWFVFLQIAPWRQRLKFCFIIFGLVTIIYQLGMYFFFAITCC